MDLQLWREACQLTHSGTRSHTGVLLSSPWDPERSFKARINCTYAVQKDDMILNVLCYGYE